MKSSALTLVFTTVFVVLLMTTFFLPTSATIVAETVKFEPKYMDLTNTPAPEENVTATIRFEDPHSGDELDIKPDTVRLEGSLLLRDWETGTKPPEFIAKFNRGEVIELLLAKAGHMGAIKPHPLGKYMIYLTITGELDNETPFHGTGHIKVTVGTSSALSPPPT